MTEPSTTPTTRLLTRRQGLIALAIAAGGTVVAACSSSSTPAPPTAVPSSATPADETLANEQELIAKYDVAIAGLPTLAKELTALRDQHAQHVTALGGTPPGTSPSTAVVPGFPGPSAGQQSIIQALIVAERSAAAQRIEACVAATDPTAARTLTFIAASEASHLPALKDLQA
jgi:hypothetical protein